MKTIDADDFWGCDDVESILSLTTEEFKVVNLEKKKHCKPVKPQRLSEQESLDIMVAHMFAGSRLQDIIEDGVYGSAVYRLIDKYDLQWLNLEREALYTEKKKTASLLQAEYYKAKLLADRKARNLRRYI